MKVAAAALVLAACAPAAAFVPASIPSRSVAARRCPAHALRMSTTPETATPVEEPKPVAPPAPKAAAPSGGALVPINPENIEFGAGALAALAGLVVGGPVLAVILSIAANFGSKQDNEVGTALRGVTQATLSTLNFLAGVNAKYDVTGQAGSALGGAVTKLKETDDTKALEKVEVTLKEATSTAAKLAGEYDLLAKGKQALGVVGEVADKAIVKTVELEKEYKVVDKVVEKVKSSVTDISKTL